jgi:ABC-type polysaccharide/polyol phosphate export permease
MNLIQQCSTINLKDALSIQFRVIHALMMREIITRYGRDNLGFLWMFLEPILFTLGVILLRGMFFSNQRANFPLVGFLLTGYLAYTLFRNIINQLSKSTAANRSLLHHNNVTILDLILARFILEFLGVSGAFFLISAGFIYFGLMELPVNLTLSILSWLLLAWFSLSFGMILLFFMERSSLFKRIWPIFMLALLPISGVFFMVSWMPPVVQSILLWLPMVNAIELLREAFLGPEIHALYSVYYLITVNLMIMIIGLLLIKTLRRYLES